MPPSRRILFEGTSPTSGFDEIPAGTIDDISAAVATDQIVRTIYVDNRAAQPTNTKLSYQPKQEEFKACLLYTSDAGLAW